MKRNYSYNPSREYEPTREEIETETARIRAGWSVRERLSRIRDFRRLSNVLAVHIPIIDTSLLDDWVGIMTKPSDV